MSKKIYTCVPCNLKISDSGNFSKHKKTQKHIINDGKYEKRSNIAKKIHINAKEQKENIKNAIELAVQKEKESMLKKILEEKDKIISEKNKIIDNNDKILGECVGVMQTQADANKKSETL